MKLKKISLVLILCSFSVSSFSFGFGGIGGGFKGPLPVEEVGANVKMNTLSKIEQARATLENIQQTKNQFIQLANEAKHLEVWGAKLLQQTTGLTQRDIDNVLAIKKMSGELYGDIKTFQTGWKDLFEIDYSKLSPEEFAKHYEQNASRYDNLVKRTAEEKGRAKEQLEAISEKMRTFNTQNQAVTGTNQALQLGNEILNSMNANVAQLNFTLKQQEATRAEKEALLKEKEEMNSKIRRDLYKEKFTLPTFKNGGYYEI